MEQSCTYTEKHARGRDKDTSKEKHYDRLLFTIYKHLDCFTFWDSAPHHSHKRKEKGHPQKTRAPDRVRRPPWCGARMTERAPRDRRRPRGAMVGELSLALSSRVRRLRGRAGKALSSRPRSSCLDPDRRTQHTRLGAQGE